SAEILARKLLAGDGLKIGVDVGRLDRVRRAIVADVVKQRLAGQLLHAAHDARKSRIGERHFVTHTALAAEAKAQLRTAHAHLPLAQRRQAERSVLARILLVADANESTLQQTHHGGEHLLARQAGPRQIARHLPANARQGAAECREPRVLVGVAHLAPTLVIAVLFTPARIAPARLQMAIVVRANPHIGPGRRNHQRADARQRGAVADRAAIRAEITKSVAGSYP